MVDCHQARKMDQPCLGCTIGDRTGGRDMAQLRSDQYDGATTALAHQRHHETTHQKRPGEGNIDFLVPMLGIEVLYGAFVPWRGSVVNIAVEPSELRTGQFDHRTCGFEVSHIAARIQRSRTELPRGTGCGFRIKVRAHYDCTLGDATGTDCNPDVACCAADQHHLSIKSIADACHDSSTDGKRVCVVNGRSAAMKRPRPGVELTLPSCQTISRREIVVTGQPCTTMSSYGG